MKLQYDNRVSLGHIYLAIVFIATAAMWYATVGRDIEQIKITQKGNTLMIQNLESRMTMTERNLAVTLAVSAEQVKYIMASLERLQRERGIDASAPPTSKSRQ